MTPADRAHELQDELERLRDLAEGLMGREAFAAWQRATDEALARRWHGEVS